MAFARAFVSCSLTDTKCRYAQIEKEAMALTWACERFSEYVLGKQIYSKVVSIHWTGLLDWNTGLDYWTGLFSHLNSILARSWG